MIEEKRTAEEVFKPYFEALPPSGTRLSEKKREAWLGGMRAMFDYVYTTPDPLQIDLTRVLIQKLHGVAFDSPEFKGLFEEVKSQIQILKDNE